MRLTIERLRTLVLVVGILIIAAIFITLGVGKWKNRFIKRDIPQRLGAARRLEVQVRHLRQGVDTRVGPPGALELEVAAATDRS